MPSRRALRSDGPDRRSRTVATRWPSRSTTSTRQPSWSKPSPTSGMRPSSLEHEPGQGLVVAFGHDEPARLEHLVAVQGAVEQPLAGALRPG